ncbi:MAG: cell division topological specificity factor MinE [Defluviitaleaceae bacterium]|nr:cell division topological specificity factor MinE [Defluviitaleaceae bacterium]
MLGIFKKTAPSKDVARDRLKMILVTDRMDGSAHVLEMMKNELLMVIQKYLHIDENDFDLQICQQSHDGDDESPRLRADIPIKSVKRR